METDCDLIASKESEGQAISLSLAGQAERPFDRLKASGIISARGELV